MISKKIITCSFHKKKIVVKFGEKVPKFSASGKNKDPSLKINERSISLNILCRGRVVIRILHTIDN